MLAIIFAIISAVAAELGGFLALGKKSRLNLTLGFTAGALVGLVAFDLLPEIFEIANSNNFDSTIPMISLVVGFLLFHTVERAILIHKSNEENYTVHQHPDVGVLGAVALIGHSFLDGVSIGLAFQVDQSVGIAVAVAVVGHRFADGFNGVNLMIYHKNSQKRALRVLAIVALAPLIGALSTLLFSVPETVLATYLGFFAGFLIYIGASDILPQAHSKGSSRMTIVFTILGAAFMFLVTRFV
jgi:ZIP family zinc transporter